MNDKKVLVAMPCMDGKMHVQVVMSLISVLAAARNLIRPYWRIGDSNIRHCRNECVQYFKTRATECEELFFLDTDIVFSLEDFTYMFEGDTQTCVAPYARKQFGMQAVGFGLGFARIHRSVFEQLDAWVNEEGEEMLGRYYSDGQIATDYFFEGASTDARWFGEDTGFWHWCAINKITTRFETRARLGHIGQHVYGYPDQLNGAVPAVSEDPYRQAQQRLKEQLRAETEIDEASGAIPQP